MKSALVLAAAIGVTCALGEAEAFAQAAPTTATTDSSTAAPTTVTPADAPPIDVSHQTAPATDTTVPLDNAAAPASKEKDGDKPTSQNGEIPHGRSPQMKRAMVRTTTWDLNLELGYGRVFRDPAHWEGFFRGGAGILFVRDPLFWVLRFTYDYSPRSNATLGTELEVNSVETGLWGNIGLMKDANSRYWGGRASLGFAIFGIEGEYRGDAQAQTYFAVYGKLRLPLGVIGQVLK